MTAPRFLDAASSEIESGVNEAGEPFCKTRHTATDGTVLLGQLDPAEVRSYALGWLEAAEAAEQEAAVLRTLRKLNLGETADKLAGAVIRELRDRRSQS